ncbi:oxidoreductase [Salipiger thiooxidans]|uniref:NADH-quinone oxidoreductase subunit B family protein n=1 Tax=Salipiger thiooxidans TaxID=282683 RepID=UPI001A8EA89A|nr:oxidoreductase [Salipiger thiooxidans]MBN8188033.1 oxidoreductase [Salipiger thiooxidans]
MTRPNLAVWKFASCDGCQLSILDCEDELLAIADRIDIAYFPEASSRMAPGPYDLSLVEGSITTADDVARIKDIRERSRTLVAIGACATAGGIQALRNTADVAEWTRLVYPRPEYIETLATSTAIADHVRVDLELHGCPVSKAQLVELVTAVLAGRKPQIPNEAQCVECKRHGTPCVMVSHGTPCLGPVTRAGCGNLCPSVGRGCYGCFGPVEGANTDALSEQFRRLGVPEAAQRALYGGFTCAAPAFAAARDRHD